MPGPISVLAATVWVGMATYLVLSLLRALVFAWLDVRRPAAVQTPYVARGDAHRAAA